MQKVCTFETLPNLCRLPTSYCLLRLDVTLFATSAKHCCAGALYEICNHDALSIAEQAVFDQVYSLIRRVYWQTLHTSSYIYRLRNIQSVASSALITPVTGPLLTHRELARLSQHASNEAGLDESSLWGFAGGLCKPRECHLLTHSCTRRGFAHLDSVTRHRLVDGLCSNLSVLCLSASALVAADDAPDEAGEREVTAASHRSALHAYIFFLSWLCAAAESEASTAEPAASGAAGAPNSRCFVGLALRDHARLRAAAAARCLPACSCCPDCEQPPLPPLAPAGTPTTFPGHGSLGAAGGWRRFSAQPQCLCAGAPSGQERGAA